MRGYATDGAPDERGGARRPVRRRRGAGQRSGIPRSGAHGDGHLQVGIWVDEAEVLCPIECRANAVAAGRDDLVSVSGEQIRRGTVLKHRAHERQSAGPGYATLEVGQLSDEIGEGVFRRHGGLRVGGRGDGGRGKAGFGRPPAVECLSGRSGLLRYRG